MRRVPAWFLLVLLAGCGGGDFSDPPAPRQPAVPAVTRAAQPAPVLYRIQQQFPAGCLAPLGAAAAGAGVSRAPCDDADNDQIFELPSTASEGRGSLRHHASGLCVAAQGELLVLQACADAASQVVSWRSDSDSGPAARQVRLPNMPLRETGGARLYRAVAASPAAWQLKVTDTWQWQLQGTINTSYDVKVYDIDLFETPQPVIDSLKAAGRRVICYFSAGSSEDWRSDFSDFRAADMGSNLDGWPGERWLDTRSSNVRNIMKARLDHAVARGCDGVEPDNMDAYLNDPGLPLTAATQLDYNRFIGTEARARGLKVGLKNAVDLLEHLEPYYDFAVNEQCHQYNECDGYAVFTSRGKPVFNAEYASKWRTDPVKRAQLCAASAALNIRTLVLPLALDDSFRFACD